MSQTQLLNGFTLNPQDYPQWRQINGLYFDPLHWNDNDEDALNIAARTRDAVIQQKRSPSLGSQQNVLLLHAAKQKYALATQDIPKRGTENEVLIRILAIGLNPIDWKAPAFGFGLASLPCINGRDFAGVVVQAPKSSSRIKTGDVVLSASTDYRDYRKSAFQEYSISNDFNCCRIPSHVSPNNAAAQGVAFVTATLALGVCFGVDFSKASSDVQGPDLLSIARALKEEVVPEDVREECFHSISLDDRPKRGDWLAIWGASSATGFIALQLAKFAGLKVVCIVDAEKHGARLVNAGADLLVDRINIDRAISIVRAVTGGRLRFGLDTVGKETATSLQSVFGNNSPEPTAQAHIVGLTGLPKERLPGIAYHNVPIKLFHTIPEIGEAVVTWMEELLNSRDFVLQETVTADGGLGGVNDALEVLRSGARSGTRIVVPLQNDR
ncbi:MAG: hypothetical protein M4579_002652 [Chaenotheca gracillima]|nr:MAG: hypothetical protein M4579_002652 [Chaenotheca gracillima]